MNTSPLIEYLAAQSSHPGTYYQLLDFKKRNMPFKASRFIVKPSQQSKTDKHIVEELWIISSGNGLLKYGDHRVEIKEGDFFKFESNIEHTVTNTGNEELIIYSIWW